MGCSSSSEANVARGNDVDINFGMFTSDDQPTSEFTFDNENYYPKRKKKTVTFRADFAFGSVSPLKDREVEPSQIPLIASLLEENDVIANFFFHRNVRKNDIHKLAEKFRTLKVEKNQWIRRPHDDSPYLYILADGVVSEKRSFFDLNFQDYSRKTFDAKCVFGERNFLLSTTKRDFGYYTNEDSTIHLISKDDFNISIDSLTKRDSILTVPMFSDLLFDERRKLCKDLIKIKYNKGDTILKRGEPVNSFYVVSSGYMKLILHSKDWMEVGHPIEHLSSYVKGTESLIDMNIPSETIDQGEQKSVEDYGVRVIGIDDCFGEDCMILGMPCPGDIIALVDCEIFEVDKMRFIQSLGSLHKKLAKNTETVSVQYTHYERSINTVALSQPPIPSLLKLKLLPVSPAANCDFLGFNF